ncbi:MAG: hypothetical protein HYZ13_09415 [Acidobacteria bacterium]|nr:hypothetical protein [Acidobacteriota bacterium]
MKRTLGTLVAALTLATSAQAQVKISGLVQVWWNLTTPSDLRNNSTTLPTAAGGRTYYNLRSEFRENTFAVRRTELKASGKITDDLDWEVMMDPSISPSTTNSILQDAVLAYKAGGGFTFKVGQMKAFQTLEGMTSSSELLFVERSQMGRTLGDVRQRGAAGSYSWGDGSSFGGRATVGLFNGAPKVNDSNAAKDVAVRLDFTAAKMHHFGAYGLRGTTDLNDKDSSALTARTFTGAVGAPTPSTIVANKDLTSHLGLYYAFQMAPWQASWEFVTGRLGRGFGISSTATLVNGAPAAALREHLDQKFMGQVLTGAYTFGHHTFMARLDVMDYNAGDDWYTASNPYHVGAADYTPRYTEVSVGYQFALKPESVKSANLKVNYISRSKNFLAPRAAAGQTSEQGGDTIVAGFQVAF